ncbi:MAG: pseudaminic acid cytidylyltransferase [Gimesia sp.]
MNIAVIPARGGSKRIPRKNIKNFCGKPMIAWSIEAALESNCFERIIVSTDDDEIATVALSYGAEVPFMRPESLSDNYVGTTAVVSHAVKWLIEHGEKLENVCCLYATAPFVRSIDLQRGLELLQTKECDYAFSVTSFTFPIQRAIRITQTQRVEMFQPEHFMTRSQDLEEAYHDAGQFYWGTNQAWLDEKSLFSNYSAPVILPRYRVQDIDTQEDWQRAEWLFKALQAVGE